MRVNESKTCSNLYPDDCEPSRWAAFLLPWTRVEAKAVDIFEMGRIAKRYDTEMAHAMLCAVAVAYYEGSMYGFEL